MLKSVSTLYFVMHVDITVISDGGMQITFKHPHINFSKKRFNIFLGEFVQVLKFPPKYQEWGHEMGCDGGLRRMHAQTHPVRSSIS